MKKTLVTLLALGSVAVADDYTFSSYYTENETKYSAIDEFVGKAPDPYDACVLYGNITVKLKAAAMLGSELEEGTQLTLNSLSVLNHSSKDFGAGSTVSITIGGTTYTSNEASSDAQKGVYNLITYTFDGGPTFSIDDELNFTMNILKDSMLDFGIVNQTLEGAAIVREKIGSFIPAKYGAFQIKASTTAPVPEPTTATLSLLALAGLAARRRRK